MVIDSIFIGVFFAVAFALVVIGHTTRQRIFNLLSTGVFIFLATQLYEYVAIMIVLVGLVFYEIYYTFWGE